MRFVYHILAAMMLVVLLGNAAQSKKPVRPHLLHRESLSNPWFLHDMDEFEVRPPLLAPKRAELLFAGDLMQHMPQVAAARQADGRFEYAPSFQYVKPLFDGASLSVVNLETTLTASSDYSGYPCFRSPVALAGALRDLGVDVCMLANNHCCDGGAQGVHTTLAALDRCGIARTGVFADSADYRANHPLRIAAGEMRIALLNYTYGTNGIPAPKGVIVNYIDTLAMARDLDIARDGQSDCVVVYVHWGNEYERQPNAEQRRLAGFLRRHGADVIIGSHPHVVQPFENTQNGVTFYSLGNFVSNQRNRFCDGGILARVQVSWRPDKPLAFDVQAIPIWVLLPFYRILPAGTADTVQMPAWMRAHYDRFADDTYKLLYW